MRSPNRMRATLLSLVALFAMSCAPSDRLIVPHDDGATATGGGSGGGSGSGGLGGSPGGQGGNAGGGGAGGGQSSPDAAVSPDVAALASDAPAADAPAAVGSF